MKVVGSWSTRRKPTSNTRRTCNLHTERPIWDLNWDCDSSNHCTTVSVLPIQTYSRYWNNKISSFLLNNVMQSRIAAAFRWSYSYWCKTVLYSLMLTSIWNAHVSLLLIFIYLCSNWVGNLKIDEDTRFVYVPAFGLGHLRTLLYIYITLSSSSSSCTLMSDIFGSSV